MSKQLPITEATDFYLNNKGARRFVLFAICLGATLGPFALSSVNLALPVIALDLNANAVLVSWMPTGFMLSSVMSMLPMGKLADQYGRKRFYFWGVLSTSLFSVIASFGQSMEWLLAFRLLQGISMSMVFGSGMAIVTSIYPASERGSAIGLYTASVYIALTLSPVIGGWMTEWLGWRSVFWIQAPIGIAVVIMLFSVKGEWKSLDKTPFDWTGSVIFACWMGTLVYGLSGLPKLSAIVTLIISFAYFWLFIYHQNRVDYPLIQPDMFRKNRMFSFSLLAAIFIYGASYPMGFLLSLFLQLALGYSPFAAGKILLVQAMVMAVVAPFAGKLSDRFDSGKIAVLGCALMALGFIQVSLVSASPESVAVISTGFIFLGLGFGLFSTPNINVTMSSISKSEVGFASASVSLARTVGNMFGMSLASLLIYNLIGATEFTGDQTKELTSTVRIWASVCIVFAVLSALLCFFRGVTRKAVDIEKTCDDLPL